MRKLNILVTAIMIVVTAAGAFAQAITGSSVFSPNAGGARILSAQGNTAANPAIGFQSSVSTPLIAQNDGGGGNGIFRPTPNEMAFATGSLERMRISSAGFIGIGTLTPLHKLHVNDGALMLSGAVAGFGGPQLLFSDNLSTHPNGRWAIEYITPTSTKPSMGGLNFWTPFNTPGSTGSAGNYSLFLKNDGKIGMGVTDDSSNANFCATALPTGYRLYVNGGILTTKVKVANYCSSSWADYVFANNYNLKPLTEVETFIKENKHLPNVPSATELEKEGLDIAAMQSKQMEKIEELTLYLIEMKKEINDLKKENIDLKNAINTTSK